jgi:phasin family protein
MYVTPEQVAANSRAGVEALIALAHSNFATAEKFAALNFNTTKSMFEDGMNHARALLNAKDVQELVNLNAAVAQPNIERVIAYSRSVYELATQAQAEFTRVLEGQAGEFNKNVAGILDKLAKNAPAGSDVAVAAVKSAIAAANSAYSSFSQVAKQATEMAEQNITNATAVVGQAAKKKVA